MKKMILVILISIIYKIGFSCHCVPYEPNFYKNISSLTHNCIAIVDSIFYIDSSNGLHTHAAYFVVSDTLDAFGHNIGDTILVTGQDGLNCGEGFFGFNQGDTTFLALSNGRLDTLTFKSYYLEGACGRYFLPIKNGYYGGLTIPEIKSKITKLINNKEPSCFCQEFSYYNDFFHTVSSKTYNCLAVFKRFDYSYQYNNLNSATGFFILLDTIGYFNSQIGDTIVVIGEDGKNCGEMLYNFTIGDTMFLALSDGYYNNFNKDTFYLKGFPCGDFSITVKNDKFNNMTINEIKQKIKSIITNISDSRIFDLKIYPNPTNDIITITSTMLIDKIEIFDMSGYSIACFDNINHNMYDIDLSRLANSIYSISIYSNKQIINRSVIKK